MKTAEFNLKNWTGEKATIRYTDNGKFEMYDYNWEVGGFVEVFRGEGYRKLICRSDEGIGEATLMLKTSDIEEAIIAAGCWIANHV